MNIKFFLEQLILFVILSLAVTGCGLTSETPYENPPAPPSPLASSLREPLEERVPQSINKAKGLYAHIKGLKNHQPVLLTVKSSAGHIIGTLQTNYNKKVNLNSLNLENETEYTITAESSGYRVSKPKTITTADEEPVFIFEKIQEDIFHYHWESDFNNEEYEYSSQVPEAPQIEFLDKVLELPHHSAANILLEKYNIILSNEGLSWTLDYSNRLLRTVSDIPHYPIQRAKFILKSEFIENDIKIETINGKKIISISTEAFNNAEPRMVLLNGVKGRFFSRRLFQALTHFYTENGSNFYAVEKILNDKFSLSLEVPNIRNLTGEHPSNFQDFHFDEIMNLISALAEMPKGYHKIPGLRYLLRRQDGHPHPLYPEAPAVAWARGPHSNSYIEFMDKAFMNQMEDYIHRLILHEKTHFIWSNVLTQEIREDWIETAGWYRNPEDPDGWSNRYTTSFVSPYAHQKNPEEDIAETISFYVLNPDKLLSVAPEKFDFIQRRIMKGYRYMTQIREDLQFEVFNLFPDYDYPGKIKRLDIYAYGAKDEEKRVKIEIELLHKDGFNDGATWASLRLHSEADTFVDVGLHPSGNNPHILTGWATIPANAKAGYWKTNQITIQDEHRNTRTEGVNDFGFKLYINNEKEDTILPQYVQNSLHIQVEPAILEGKPVHKVQVTWDIEENMKMKSRNGVFLSFISLDSPQSYALQKYGDVDLTTNQAKVVFHITEYFPSGKYTVAYLRMQDKALNYGTQYFSNDPEHEARKIVHIETSNHDQIKPSLDLNRISISATPSVPDNPDGQTSVTITYYAKDDKSGLDQVSYILMDPLGKTFHSYHYHNNFYSTFFKGNPSVYKKYVIHHILPRGSAPGIWGLKEMRLQDKGGNSIKYNFVETLHFEVD